MSSLIADICLPPSLITTILDTEVSDSWISSIGELEQHLDTLQARGRVKAAKDMVELMAQVQLVVRASTRIPIGTSPHSPPNKATGKIRAFFMAILKPIKSSMTTNMQVIQTSVLLKYRPLYTFLQRRAANVALEFQRSYIAAARVYYETGFRRYTRSLSWIKVNPGEHLMCLHLIVIYASSGTDGREIRKSRVFRGNTALRPVEVGVRSNRWTWGRPGIHGR